MLRIQQARVAELDGLRGLAILFVLTWHYVDGQALVATGTVPAYTLRLMSFAWAGVDVFFVLSGYFVGKMLIKARDRGCGVGEVLVRRVFRIVPLYAISLLLFLVLSATFHGERDRGLAWLLDNPMPPWSYALLVQNFEMALAGEHGANWLGITWSLALEVQFYLFLAAFVRLVPRRMLGLALTALVALAVATRVSLTLSVPKGGFAAFLILPGRCDSVALGVLAAMIVADQRRATRIAAHCRLMLCLVGAAFSIVVALCAKGDGIGSIGMNAVGHLLLACASSAMIVLLVASPDGRVRRAFRSPLLVAFGTISYGIYVMHQPVAGLLHHVLLNQAPKIANGLDAAVTLLALTVTLALSYVSWVTFERPMIALGRKLTMPRPEQTA